MPVVRARCSGPGISRHTPAGVREGAAREHAGSILAEMSIAALRRAPPAVLAFLLVSTATISYGLAQASPKFWQHPVRPALVILLLVLWLAAVVLWRQRWAWALSLIASGVGVASGLWEGVTVFAFVSNLVTFGLLISPGMRRYVGVYRRHDPST
jgi:hypothetical protein